MRIFLCYAIQDAETASFVASGLANNGYILNQNIGGILGGPNWQKDVEKEISLADLIIIMATHSYKSSPVARWQIELFINQAKPLFIVVASKIVNDSIIGLDIETWLNSFEPPLGSTPYLYSTLDIHFLGEAIANYLESFSEIFGTHQALKIDQKLPTLSSHTLSRIFVAYSRKQLPLAKQIYEVLIKNGKAVFYDQKLKAGSVWRQTIQKALDDATHVVVIWTTDASQSDEVEREVSYALAKRKVIIPILGRDIPELPYHLHGLHYLALEEDLNKIEKQLLKAIADSATDEDIWQ